MRSLALTAVLILSLAACGTDTGAGDEAEAAAATEAVAITDELDFTTRTLDGDELAGTSLEGKDAVLWFWAPWCTQCRREAPYVAASESANADVVFLGVAGLGEIDAMNAFVDDYEVGGFDHVADLDGSLWQRFGVVQQPAYAFIDDTGTVEVIRGEIGEDGIAEGVAALTGS